MIFPLAFIDDLRDKLSEKWLVKFHTKEFVINVNPAPNPAPNMNNFSFD